MTLALDGTAESPGTPRFLISMDVNASSFEELRRALDALADESDGPPPSPAHALSDVVHAQWELEVALAADAVRRRPVTGLRRCAVSMTDAPCAEVDAGNRRGP